MSKFPKIANYKNFIHNLRKSGIIKYKTVRWNAKPKIHGTNASIVIENGKVAARSKKHDLTLEKDNYGFCRWVTNNAKYFKGIEGFVTVKIYGEWAGPGIQKKVAVNQLLEKHFFVFMIKIGNNVIINPKYIRAHIFGGLIETPKNIKILPYVLEEIDVEEVEDLQKVETLVKEFDECDPYIKKEFGIEGVGEGLVLYPAASFDSITTLCEHCFKARGQKHSVESKVKTFKSPKENTESKVFAKTFVNENRVNQACQELSIEKGDMTKMGEFLKWIHHDILSETEAEREELDLTWKELSRDVTFEAKYFFTKENELGAYF